MERAVELYKKYFRESKMARPRAVFLFLFSCLVVMLVSSFVTGASFSIASFLLANPATYFLGAAFFLFSELFFLFFALVVQYGLFLCVLRLLRKQPVALSFLFTGFRQKRAKKFAAFFFIPAILSLSLSAVPFFSLPEFSDPKTLLDYFTREPAAAKIMLESLAIFSVSSIVLFLPFSFAWPFAYDSAENSFRPLLKKSVGFFFKRIRNFLAFEFLALIRPLFVFFLTNAAQFFLTKYFSENSFMAMVSSVVGFVSFFSLVLFLVGIILSIDFYYENSNAESSN